jgi:ABC-type bacteriocin/lantibiotic exporter with double-glycine peptidase domain
MQLARAKTNASQLTEQEERETGNTGLKAYLDYLQQANGFVLLFFSIAAYLVFVVGQAASNWWMASEVDNPAMSTSKLVIIYSSITLTTVSFVFLRSALLAMMGVAASRSFFVGMINSLFYAPMTFFDSTPTGRILSRVLCIPFASSLISPVASLLSYSTNQFVSRLLTVMIFWCRFLPILVYWTWIWLSRLVSLLQTP